jgi:hypothetical protein
MTSSSSNEQLRGSISVCRSSFFSFLLTPSINNEKQTVLHLLQSSQLLKKQQQKHCSAGFK